MERKITGTLDVNIDPSGMEAQLVFTPSEEGTEWDVHAVMAFLEKKRIKEGYNTASVDSIFPVLMKAEPGDSPVIEVVATGIPAGEPTDEVIAWEESPVPEHLTEDGSSFFKKAPAPEFFNIRIEKVQKKKIIKEKKSRFLAAREKEVTVTESREIREPVSIDPETVGTGWVNVDDFIAEITPAVPGEDGKDVYGRPVPAVKPEENLHLGAGVERKDNNLVAVKSGFLRRGKNWVQVLPFQPHKWKLDLSKDKNTVLLTFKPGEKGAFPPQAELLLKEAVALGVGEETLITPFELGNILHDAIEKNKTITSVPISSNDDGFFEILITADKIKAILNMKKGRGMGKPLVLKEFGKALKEKGLKNVDYKKVQEEVLAFYRGDDLELSGYELAVGEPPEEPGERKTAFTLNYMDENEIRIVKESAAAILSGNGPAGALDGIESLENYPIDTVDKMAMVTSGMVIAEISQEPGKPGKDVFGNKIEFQEISDTGFRFLAGIERQGEKIFTTAEGLLEQWDKDGITALRVRPHKNSIVEVKVAANKMSGSITLHPSIGTGIPLKIDAIDRVIQEKGITYGVNREILERAVEHANQGDDIRDLVFANGQPPENGEEAKLEFLVALAKDKGVTIKADGRADYRNQDHITLVKKGQPIARLIRSNVQSRDGVDILGGSIPSKDTPQDTLEVGENIEQKEEGNEILYSAASGGELCYENKKISVLNVHVVKGNVGKESGNIKFSGTVKVGGLVQSGYVVMSQEDIFVKDSVEASLLSSGGEIVIEKGIIGGGKAILRSRKTIKATFAEQCTLLAIEDISFKRSCMQCSVKTNGKLNVVGDKGVILGGKILAREGVDTYNLGSEKQIKTMVSFGQDYLIYDQIELEEKEIEKIKSRIIKVDLQLKKAEKDGLSDLINKMRAEKLKLMKIIEKRSMRVLMLRERFEEHHSSDLRIRGTVYPGVILESHGRTLDVREQNSNITYYFDLETGHIKMKKNKEN
ncbi:MAG: DUF342 domain-containing protein [Spirochaetales bacterium]|nr:DUF342 domain-containing protein [Spirochaetales bacterium]